MFNHYIFKDTFYIDEKKKIKEKQLENQKCRKNYDQLYQICKSELEEKGSELFINSWRYIFNKTIYLPWIEINDLS